MTIGRCWVVGLGLAGCAAEVPVVTMPAGQTSARFEPAPVPHGGYRGQGGVVRVYDAALPPKMPLGTGAVPGSNSPVRGSVMTGWKQSF